MSAPVKAHQEKRKPQPPCLCLACKRLECHGIGKPLSHDAAIRAAAVPKLCSCPAGKRCER